MGISKRKGLLETAGVSLTIEMQQLLIVLGSFQFYLITRQAAHLAYTDTTVCITTQQSTLVHEVTVKTACLPLDMNAKFHHNKRITRH